MTKICDAHLVQDLVHASFECGFYSCREDDEKPQYLEAMEKREYFCQKLLERLRQLRTASQVIGQSEK